MNDRIEVAGPIAAVGTVATLSRFPVKSMQGERLSVTDLTASGLVGDRAYALLDRSTGKVVSAKHPRIGPQVLACRATFLDEIGPDVHKSRVLISLPDGTTVSSDDRDANATLSSFLGLDVTLERSAPEDFTIDHFHPDLASPDPEEPTGTVTESKLGAAFFAKAGIASPVPDGSFLDVFPVSLLTTSTLEQLQVIRPESRFDARRFRMNVVVDTPADGFVEDLWTGRSLQIGETVRLSVVLPDPRCVMITLAQDDLPTDIDILRTLVQHHRVEVAGRLRPCAGAYAVVEVAGTVSTGDQVSLV